MGVAIIPVREEQAALRMPNELDLFGSRDWDDSPCLPVHVQCRDRALVAGDEMQRAIEIGSPAPVAGRRPPAALGMKSPASSFRGVDLKPLEQVVFGESIVLVCLQ